jgi:ATPase subunit of ABC transporter with duplicated ATPase domains
MVLRPNLLVLDEPTNHLDIPAREAIEEALAEFEGTILVVSHDRYFLDKVVERVVSVEDRSLVSYNGGFTEFWLQRRRMLDRSGRLHTRGKARRGAGSADSDKLSEMERRINELEREKMALEHEAREALTNRDRNAARNATRRAENIEARLETLYEAWMAAAE